MNVVYNSFLRSYTSGSISLETDEFKMILMKDTYEPSADHFSYIQEAVKLHEAKDANEEIYAETDLGYKRGGKGILFKKSSSDNEKVYFSLTAPVTWKKATVTVRYAIIYRVSDNLLISCYDFGSNQVCENNDLTLDWSYTHVLSFRLDVYNSNKTYARSIQSISYESLGEGQPVTLNITVSEDAGFPQQGTTYSFQIYNDTVKEDIREYIISKAETTFDKTSTTTNLVQGGAIAKALPDRLEESMIDELFRSAGK